MSLYGWRFRGREGRGVRAISLRDLRNEHNP